MRLNCDTPSFPGGVRKLSFEFFRYTGSESLRCFMSTMGFERNGETFPLLKPVPFPDLWRPPAALVLYFATYRLPDRTLKSPPAGDRISEQLRKLRILYSWRRAPWETSDRSCSRLTRPGGPGNLSFFGTDSLGIWRGLTLCGTTDTVSGRRAVEELLSAGLCSVSSAWGT